MKYYSVLALAILASMQARADGAAAADKVWTTSAELGAIVTSGNTVGTSVSGKIDAKQELQQWSNQYIFSAFFKEDEIEDANGNPVTERSAERYMASVKAAYKLDEEFDKLLPNSELFWIEKCGHAAMMEHPNQFNEILYHWLQKNNI